MNENVCSKCGANMDGSGSCKACGRGVSAPDSDAVRQKRSRVTEPGKGAARTIAWIAGAAAVGVAAALVLFAVRGKESGMSREPRQAGGQQSAFTVIAEEGGVFRVPLDGIADGRTHFFSTTVNGSTVKFLVLRKQDGSYGVALDACNACYRAKLGYRDGGDRIICNNCGMAFQPGDVGIVSGGCNPIPLAHRITSDAVTISVKDLQQFTSYF